MIEPRHYWLPGIVGGGLASLSAGAVTFCTSRRTSSPTSHFSGQIGNERHAIAGVLATQHPNGLVGRRGFRVALGALRGVTGVPLTSNLRGDNILWFFLGFSLREPNRGWLELDLFFLPNLLGLCRVRQWHRYGLRLGDVVARATAQ